MQDQFCFRVLLRYEVGLVVGAKQLRSEVIRRVSLIPSPKRNVNCTNICHEKMKMLVSVSYTRESVIFKGHDNLCHMAQVKNLKRN